MELPRFAWTVTGMVRDDEAAPPGSYRYIDARVEGLIREDERAACAELARAAGCLCDFLADGDARWADCGSCQGRGYAPPSLSVACAACHGQGTTVANHDHRCPAAILAAIEARGRD